jgi:hypothetical protein
MMVGGADGGWGSITGSLRLRRCNEETGRNGAETMEGTGGGAGCCVAEAFGVRFGSGMEGGVLDSRRESMSG